MVTNQFQISIDVYFCLDERDRKLKLKELQSSIYLRASTDWISLDSSKPKYTSIDSWTWLVAIDKLGFFYFLANDWWQYSGSLPRFISNGIHLSCKMTASFLKRAIFSAVSS